MSKGGVGKRWRVECKVPSNEEAGKAMSLADGKVDCEEGGGARARGEGRTQKVLLSGGGQPASPNGRAERERALKPDTRQLFGLLLAPRPFPSRSLSSPFSPPPRRRRLLPRCIVGAVRCSFAIRPGPGPGGAEGLLLAEPDLLSGSARGGSGKG